MKPIWIATAVLAATIALTGCKHRREEPIPGPKAEPPPAVAPHAPSADPPPAPAGAAQPDGPRRHGASGISWFQGTVEEAFSTTCGKCTAKLLQEALDHR